MRILKTSLLGLFGMIPLLLVGKEAMADYREYGPWGVWPGRMLGWCGWGGLGWFGPIFMLVFWALFIFLIILLIRRLLAWGPAGFRDRSESALDILKKRYARGEIDRDEFEMKKKDLTE